MYLLQHSLCLPTGAASGGLQTTTIWSSLATDIVILTTMIVIIITVKLVRNSLEFKIASSSFKLNLIS